MEWSLTQNKLLAFHRLMRTDKPIGALLLLWPTLWALWVATPGVPQLWILAVFGADAEYDDHSVVDCRASAGVGVPVYEAVYPSTASGAGRGVWLVDSNGFCRCE